MVVSLYIFFSYGINVILLIAQKAITLVDVISI